MTTSTPATTLAYVIDPIHSNVHFSIRHLMISKVRGAFTIFSGSLEVTPGTGIPTAIQAEIAANSIDTRDPQRDGHLKSPDFFDVETYPTLRFTSTRIEAVDASHFHAFGDLTMHGTTKPVTLKAEVSGQGKDPRGNDRIGYEATARISRKDFGLIWNQALEAGGVALGDDIDISLDIEAVPTPV